MTILGEEGNQNIRPSSTVNNRIRNFGSKREQDRKVQVESNNVGIHLLYHGLREDTTGKIFARILSNH